MPTCLSLCVCLLYVPSWPSLCTAIFKYGIIVCVSISIFMHVCIYACMNFLMYVGLYVFLYGAAYCAVRLLYWRGTDDRRSSLWCLWWRNVVLPPAAPWSSSLSLPLNTWSRGWLMVFRATSGLFEFTRRGLKNSSCEAVRIRTHILTWSPERKKPCCPLGASPECVCECVTAAQNIVFVHITCYKVFNL